MKRIIAVHSLSEDMTQSEQRLQSSLCMAFPTLSKVKKVVGYMIDAKTEEETANEIAKNLFVDPVTEGYTLDSIPWDGFSHVITVGYKPGVTDNIGHTASKAIVAMGVLGNGPNHDFVHSFKAHALWGVDDEKAKSIAASLHNPIVEFSHVSISDIQLPDYNLSTEVEGPLAKEIPIRALDDEALMSLSKDGLLALNIEEMKAIQEHYKKIGREPTDIELETFAQTWSEHCVHKTLKGKVSLERKRVDGSIGRTEYENLIKETIFRATLSIREKRGKEDICVSVFKDNAGIIRFSEDYNACFKVETHNHPSAKEPYGGAATGIGGVIRDVLAAGMGANPIANTDIFCFARPDFPEEKVPEGVIHPRKIMEGVVSGVRDYGNPMGIPTVNGALYFDDRYLGNPLVFCGTAGIIPRVIKGKPSEEKKPQKGDFLVIVGGKTGRDGIHGVTFASLEMDKHTTSNPVQIGDPITERMFMEAMFKARDEGLYNFVQDCGGGGLSSALGEMAEDLGAVINLDAVPLKYSGLMPWEIWISESQERQAFSVPADKYEKFKDTFEREDVEVYNVGRITGDHKITLMYSGEKVGEIECDFLHRGVPKAELTAFWEDKLIIDEKFPMPDDLGAIIHELLGCVNVCSKEWIIRQYDSEVQGNTVLKPLQGMVNDGPGDGAIIKPLHESNEGIVIACGMNPRYGDLDPYLMAGAGIDEAIRNAVSCGANPRHVAILDNFCWGNPKDPVQMGKLVLACQACFDIATGFDAPFISGKDSLNNEYKTDEGTISIPATLLISAIGKIEDVGKGITMYFKEKGNPIYIIGETRKELGGSHYLDVIGKPGVNTQVPTTDPVAFGENYRKIHKSMLEGCILAAHDCSEGGIGICASEMAFSGSLGAEINLNAVPREENVDRDDFVLFSESNGRIIVEVARNKEQEFKTILQGSKFAKIGVVTGGEHLKFIPISGAAPISLELATLKGAWQKTLDMEGNLNRRLR